jgi:hypothetical protein
VFRAVGARPAWRQFKPPKAFDKITSTPVKSWRSAYTCVRLRKGKASYRWRRWSQPPDGMGVGSFCTRVVYRRDVILPVIRIPNNRRGSKEAAGTGSVVVTGGRVSRNAVSPCVHPMDGNGNIQWARGHGLAGHACALIRGCVHLVVIKNTASITTLLAKFKSKLSWVRLYLLYILKSINVYYIIFIIKYILLYQ